jgi:hypothetical protein
MGAWFIEPVDCAQLADPPQHFSEYLKLADVVGLKLPLPAKNGACRTG